MSEPRTLSPETPEDDAWLTAIWREEWGGETMVTRGQTRRQKPSIPLIGNHGIPIHDELELDKTL